jgi:hypothetical protein
MTLKLFTFKLKYLKPTFILIELRPMANMKSGVVVEISPGSCSSTQLAELLMSLMFMRSIKLRTKTTPNRQIRATERKAPL